MVLCIDQTALKLIISDMKKKTKKNEEKKTKYD